MKPGDIVYGKYRGRWGKCEILSITKVNKGYLWWKKTIETALVKFQIQEWDWQMCDISPVYDVLVECPVSELREIQ